MKDHGQPICCMKTMHCVAEDYTYNFEGVYWIGTDYVCLNCGSKRIVPRGDIWEIQRASYYDEDLF